MNIEDRAAMRRAWDALAGIDAAVDTGGEAAAAKAALAERLRAEHAERTADRAAMRRVATPAQVSPATGSHAGLSLRELGLLDAIEIAAAGLERGDLPGDILGVLRSATHLFGLSSTELAKRGELGEVIILPAEHYAMLEAASKRSTRSGESDDAARWRGRAERAERAAAQALDAIGREDWPMAGILVPALDVARRVLREIVDGASSNAPPAKVMPVSNVAEKGPIRSWPAPVDWTGREARAESEAVRWRARAEHAEQAVARAAKLLVSEEIDGPERAAEILGAAARDAVGDATAAIVAGTNGPDWKGSCRAAWRQLDEEKRERGNRIFALTAERDGWKRRAEDAEAGLAYVIGAIDLAEGPDRGCAVQTLAERILALANSRRFAPRTARIAGITLYGRAFLPPEGAPLEVEAGRDVAFRVSDAGGDAIFLGVEGEASCVGYVAADQVDRGAWKATVEDGCTVRLDHGEKSFFPPGDRPDAPPAAPENLAWPAPLPIPIGTLAGGTAPVYLHVDRRTVTEDARKAARPDRGEPWCWLCGLSLTGPTTYEVDGLPVHGACFLGAEEECGKRHRAWPLEEARRFFCRRRP